MAFKLRAYGQISKQPSSDQLEIIYSWSILLLSWGELKVRGEGQEMSEFIYIPGNVEL